MVTVNSKVKTPIGQGVVQGAFAVVDANGNPIVRGAAVRVPVNDETRAQLNKSNCMTPHAVLSGIWVFQESELK